jgi:site-specific recombinase XerC
MKITARDITWYLDYLKNEECASATVAKYGREIYAFAAWTEGVDVTKEVAIEYKQLQSIGMLVVLNNILNRITANRAKERSTSICYNKITVKARQAAVLFPFCCLSYNKRANWPDVLSFGLSTSVS